MKNSYMEIIRSRGKRGSGLWGLIGHEAGQANGHVDKVQIRVLFSPRIEPRDSDMVDPKPANDPQPSKNSCSVCGRRNEKVDAGCHEGSRAEAGPGPCRWRQLGVSWKVELGEQRSLEQGGGRRLKEQPLVSS